MPNPSRPKLTIASVAIAALALSLAAIGRGEPPRRQDPVDKSKVAVLPADLPTRYFFAKTCAGCHEDPKGKQPDPNFVKHTEFTSWNGTDKHSKAFANLRNDAGTRMRDRLGWKEESQEYEKCLSCHAPAIADPRLKTVPATNDAPERKADPVLRTELLADGVNCAECHGPRERWVEEHKKTEGEEAWIGKTAREKHDEFGMNDLRNPAVRTKVCASCHVGDQGKHRVVTHEMYAAGHPPLPGLEISTFSEGEPPHWWPMKDVPYLNQTDQALMKKYGVVVFRDKTKPRFDRMREHYRVDEFPTQQAKLVAVGGVVTFRESMKLFAATAPADRAASPDFARFDCAACHHDLTISEDSFRQKRGFVADPGRPPAAGWPAALVSIAIAAGDPAKRDARTKQFDDGLNRFRLAVAKAPFGDNAAAVAAAQELASLADGLAAELDARKFETADALRILKQIATIAPPDHASARQLAWAFRSVHNELGDKSPNAKEISATIDQLVESLGVRLVKGSKPDTIEREVGARLDADDRFNPDDVKRLLTRLAELLR